MRILIVRTSALGDIVHCLPALAALRRKLPEAHIGWVVEAQFAPLLADHPAIDELISVRLRTWRKRLLSASVLREMAAALSALRAFRADVALDLMGNHKGALLARLSGARRTVGAARRFRREPSSALWIREPVDAPSFHAIDRALDVAAALGVERTPVDLGGEDVSARPTVEAEAFLAERAGPFVTIQPGAGWVNKTYPPARWGKVARELHERTGLEVWVLIAPGEEDLAEAVVAASDGAARAVDAGPFAALAAIMRRSRLVLGGDTGPVHLAHALGTRVLCVIGPTDPERNGPYGAPEAVLWNRLPCSFCYRRFDEPKACLLSIPSEAVVDKALELLGSEGRGGPPARFLDAADLPACRGARA